MKFLLPFLFVLFFAQPTAVMADGCTSVDFTVGRSFDATLSPHFQMAYATGDLDGDGKPDLAVTDSATNQVAVLLNDGTGEFGPTKKYVAVSGANFVLMDDFNGDARPDLAVTSSMSTFVTILLNNGNGTFGAPSIFALGDEGFGAATGDLNSDGKKDLVVVGGTSFQNITVLLGNGAGLFSPASGSPITVEGTASSVAIADINADTKLDLVVGTFSGVYLLLGNGSGSFGDATKFFNPAGRSLAIFDFNGDTKLDVAIGSLAVGLWVSLGNGDGTFNAPTSFQLETKSTVDAIVVADVDGDAKADIAAASSSSGIVTFFKGDGTGGFATTRSYLGASVGFRFALADFDVDGDPDFVAGQSILINAGGGTLEAARAISAFTNTSTADSFSALDLAFGDFNADGRSDVAVLTRSTNFSSTRVAILLRDASGNYNFASAITVFLAGMHSVIAADFNKDGRADIAIAATISTPFSHVVSVSLSNGDGTFGSPQNINFGAQAADMLAGDVNNDTNPDFVVIGLHGEVLVGLGNGAGGFSTSLAASFVDFPRAALGDLNGDTKPDLVLTDYVDHLAAVMINNGFGGFNSPTSVAVTGSPKAVVIADFNGDTKNDLAVASENIGSEGTVSVMMGDGLGGFGTATLYPAGERPTAIVAADFDGDTKLDLAISNTTVLSGAITALSGVGDGIFKSPVSFPVGSTLELVVQDLDANGRPDLTTASGPVGLLLSKPAVSAPCLFADDLTITEGDTNTQAQANVRLSAASGQVAKVNYILKKSNAEEGLDYVFDSGVVTFQPGETTKQVPITIIGDLLDEDAESLTLNLSGPQNARISDGAAKITIDDNDPTPAISINDVSVTEPNGTFDEITATFTVSLSAPSGKTVSVDAALANGTAVIGQDFAGSPGTLIFGAGQTSKTINVTVRGDTTHEPDETYFVNLSNPVNASISDGQGLGTILNNDPIPSINISNGFGSEGVGGADTSMNFFVTLTNPSSQTISANFATADGNAIAGSDYVAASGTVTFNPGETQKMVTVTIKDDAIDEVHETFLMNLSNPVVGQIVDGEGVGTINDNDGPTVSIADPPSITEGQSGPINLTFTLTLSAPSPQSVSVVLATANGTATANFDYQRVTFRPVFFPAGATSATTNIAVFGDQAIEGNETFLVNLSQPQDCTIADGQATATILDDDTVSAQLANSAVTVNESTGKVDVTILHVGDISQPFLVNYSTSPGFAASERSDYNTKAGSFTFAPGETSRTITIFITDDVLVENPEDFFFFITGANGVFVNTPFSMAITIEDNDSGGAPNPINDSTFFVRQHYRDFLNRDPDAEGLAHWVDQIESCGADAQCREIRRINVSAAFFLSIEFQETGYFVYRAYKAAYGDTTSPNVPGTVPIVRLVDFIPDSQKISEGVIVGVGDWRQRLEDNKAAYVLDFVQRSRFVSAYPTSMTADAFISQLNTRSGNVLSSQQQADMIALLGATPGDPAKRAQVLTQVIQDPELDQLELNRAFVLMQYYGYLRRNPNDPQDVDFSGWKFWLDKLNEFNGNFVQAEMVKAFLDSTEYRARFGP